MRVIQKPKKSDKLLNGAHTPKQALVCALTSVQWLHLLNRALPIKNCLPRAIDVPGPAGWDSLMHVNSESCCDVCK